MKAFGQNIVVPQLGKTSIEWRNGYGTISDGKDTNSTNKPVRKLTSDAKSIIIYFSRSGSTELVASKIAERTSSDVLEIVVKEPYAANYQETLARANYERENRDYPELDMQVPDLNQYKMIYLGFPIWAMTLSHPMASFLWTHGDKISDKLIAPFMTEGGYGHGDSVQQITSILKLKKAVNNKFTPPLVIDGNMADKNDKRIEQWLKAIRVNEIGFKNMSATSFY